MFSCQLDDYMCIDCRTVRLVSVAVYRGCGTGRLQYGAVPWAVMVRRGLATVQDGCGVERLLCGRVAVRNGFAAVRSRCIAVVVRGVCGTEPFQGGYGAVWFGYRA